MACSRLYVVSPELPVNTRTWVSKGKSNKRRIKITEEERLTSGTVRSVYTPGLSAPPYLCTASASDGGRWKRRRWHAAECAEDGERFQGEAANLVEPDDVGHMLLLLQPLLSPQQGLHAVPAAAHALLILLLQHGAHAAQAADATAPRALRAATCWRPLGLARAARGAQSLPGAAGQLVCSQPTQSIEVLSAFDSSHALCIKLQPWNVQLKV